jgi:hypothetical protein
MSDDIPSVCLVGVGITAVDSPSKAGFIPIPPATNFPNVAPIADISTKPAIANNVTTIAADIATLANFLVKEYEYNVRNCGTVESYALIPISEALVCWADEIVFVNHKVNLTVRMHFAKCFMVSFCDFIVTAYFDSVVNDSLFGKIVKNEDFDSHTVLIWLHSKYTTLF